MPVKHIQARNVNQALAEAIWHLRVEGTESKSRNGPVIRSRGPVITEYVRPDERLVSCAIRDANHVFHLMESIWMMCGGKNVEWLLQFNSAFKQYAEENGDQYGAYGHRWRDHFRVDQLSLALEELRTPDNRRVVMAMWDPRADLAAHVRDVPCNTHIYFEVIGDRLNMTVCCRSNDIVWGAYGANAVHFSILQELMAFEIGVEVGRYYQFSNNFHLYTELGQGAELFDNPFSINDDYAEGRIKPMPLLRGEERLWHFLRDCQVFVDGTEHKMETFFMRCVAQPLKVAYLERKAKREWRHVVDTIPDCDWKQMFLDWTERRANVSE